MGQGISLKSEMNNPWFKPLFNILLHTYSIVCASVDSQCLKYLGYITLVRHWRVSLLPSLCEKLSLYQLHLHHSTHWQKIIQNCLTHIPFLLIAYFPLQNRSRKHLMNWKVKACFELIRQIFWYYVQYELFRICKTSDIYFRSNILNFKPMKLGSVWRLVWN